MGNPPLVQHHDSTAHKILSRLQAALVGKVMNFGKRFEVFQSQGRLFYQESIWALLPHVHSIPTFPGRGTNCDTLQRSRLAFNNSLHLQIRSILFEKGAPKTTCSLLTSKSMHVVLAPTGPCWRRQV